MGDQVTLPSSAEMLAQLQASGVLQPTAQPAAAVQPLPDVIPSSVQHTQTENLVATTTVASTTPSSSFNWWILGVILVLGVGVIITVGWYLL